MTIQPGSIGFFFCNHYMLGIHGGIQSLHAAVQMSVDFPKGEPGHDVYHAWATSGEPVAILLNGGFASRLEKLAQTIEVFNKEANEGLVLPFARFHEGVDELNGALTCVGLVIPGQWVSREFTRDEEEVALALSSGDPVEVAAQVSHWSMPDRLRLLRHGMSLRN